MKKGNGFKGGPKLSGRGAAFKAWVPTFSGTGRKPKRDAYQNETVNQHVAQLVAAAKLRKAEQRVLRAVVRWLDRHRDRACYQKTCASLERAARTYLRAKGGAIHFE